ncbi:MAG: hypothetical protein M3Q00_01300 [Pseudomonadota bacterium]|nr:hypothetical protein [Pseudomonadota bacterium]
MSFDSVMSAPGEDEFWSLKAHVWQGDWRAAGHAITSMLHDHGATTVEIPRCHLTNDEALLITAYVHTRYRHDTTPTDHVWLREGVDQI